MNFPIKVEGESHHEYMTNFSSWLVDTTKNSSTSQGIAEDCNLLFHAIVDRCRELMANNAQNRRSTAVIYMYWIDAKYKGAVVHDLLFPKDNLKAQMDAQNIPSVMDQVKEYLDPVTVEHSLYDVRKTSIYEIRNYTESHVDLSELLDDDLASSAELSETGHCVGVITVSWDHLIN